MKRLFPRLSKWQPFGVLPSTIILAQHRFPKDLLAESGLQTFKKVVTPLPANLKLTASEGELLSNPTHYKSIIGKLNFLTNTRPDLAYNVQCLSQFMQHPRDSHWKALQHTLNYLHSTIDQGISLKSTPQLTLQAFSNSDWELALTQDAPLLASSCSLVIPLCHGSPKNKARSQDLAQRQSLGLWLQLQQR